MFIEQSHLAGAEAAAEDEVDFGEVAVRPQESLRHIADRKQQVEACEPKPNEVKTGLPPLVRRSRRRDGLAL
ncbi:hypothetical protein [Streptomyces sp. NPDC047042]|uniref:hypothetical protein n=1 Tax=Streptomyces sp. NPDC047042 TaxID=3154807 RepID=UPI0033E7B0BC